MIYGDPCVFALQFDMVESWNIPDSNWKNGLFALYVDGKILFNLIDSVELNTTSSFYSKAPLDALKVNEIDVDASSLYRNAENYFYGNSDILIDGLFDMTCTAMGDNGCYLYFIRTSTGDRLVWSVDDGENISEMMLPKDTIKNVIKQIPC